MSPPRQPARLWLRPARGKRAAVWIIIDNRRQHSTGCGPSEHERAERVLEAYFAKKLLDYDLASNNGGWQWAAGTGCDAAPYFRIFNPALQAKRFDPAFEYIMQWVPEFQSEDYPAPIVEHVFARERALRVYKEALR